MTYARVRRSGALVLGILAVGILGPICTHVEIEEIEDNPHYCVGVGGSLGLVAQGDPEGGTYEWEGHVEPNDANEVTFLASSDPNAAGDHPVSVVYDYEDGDPNTEHRSSSDAVTVKVVAVTDVIPNPGQELWADGEDIFISPVHAMTTHLQLMAVLHPNDLTSSDLPPNFIQWTNGDDPGSQLYRYVDGTVPGETLLTAMCGTSDASATVKVVEADCLSVIGATQYPNSPDYYVAAWAEQGEITVSAILSPSVTNEGAQAIFFWDDFQGDPNAWTVRTVSRNDPGLHGFVGMCGASLAQAAITIVKIDSMTIEVPEEERSRTHPPDPNYACVQERPTGDAVALLSAAGTQVFASGIGIWDAIGDETDPNSGHFDDANEPVEVLLSPSGGNRTFTFRVGIDENIDGELEVNEVVREMVVYVIKADLGIDSNNDGSIDPNDDPNETDPPGKYVPLNGDPNDPNTHDPNNLVEIALTAESVPAGAAWSIGWWPPPGLDPYTPTIALWYDENRSQPVDSDPNHWLDPNYWLPVSQMPGTLYLEGILPSSSDGDTYLRLWIDPEGTGEFAYEDDVVVTVQDE